VSDYDPSDVRGQEQERAERARLERIAREQERADLKWLCGSKRGRRIVWRLLTQSGLFSSTFVSDALALAFAEGRRHYGGKILQAIHEDCPELYPVMVKEQKHDDADERAD
jgi:hypothetical protein